MHVPDLELYVRVFHTHHHHHPPPRRKLDNIELSFFNNSRAVELVHSFLQKGALHDMSFLQVRARKGGGRGRWLVAGCGLYA